MRKKEVVVCETCGSENVKIDSWYYPNTGKITQLQQAYCDDCDGECKTKTILVDDLDTPERVDVGESFVCARDGKTYVAVSSPLGLCAGCAGYEGDDNGLCGALPACHEPHLIFKVAE